MGVQSKNDRIGIKDFSKYYFLLNSFSRDSIR